MNPYLYFNDVTISAICNTLLHSLWQASLIALILNFALNNIPENQGAKRYKLAMLALFTCFIASVTTFYLCHNHTSKETDSPIAQHIISTTNSIDSITSPNFFDIFDYMIPYQDWLLFIWLSGAVLFTIKLLGSYVYLQWITRSNKLHHNPYLKKQLDLILLKLNTSQSIQIFESHYISGPMMIGILKPIILFPIGLVNQLSTEEIESILSHELAHVKRYDFLFNLIQSVIEIIFYYHPAIWWISANIRAEREFACDQLVVNHFNNPVNYARLLVRLQEESKFYNSNLTLAFARSNKHFTHRIKRILNMSNNRSFIREKIYALGFIGLSVFLFSFTQAAYLHNQEMSELQLEIENKLISEISDTIPTKKTVEKEMIITQKSTSKIVQKSDDQGTREEVEIEMENDQIKSMIINGKVIDPEDYDEYIEDMDIEIDIDEIADSKSLVNKTIKIELNEDSNSNDGHTSKSTIRTIIIDDNGHKEESIIDLDLGSLQGLEQLKDLEALKNLKALDILGESDLTRIQGLGSGEHMMIFLDSLGNTMDLFDNEMNLIDPMIRAFPRHSDSTSIIIRRFGDTEDIRIEGGEDHGNMQWFDQGEARTYIFSDEKDRFPQAKNRSIADQLGSKLNKDGLLELDQENEVELTGKHLKINGDKQAKNIFSKYKREYEEIMGMELTKDSKIKFNYTGSLKKERKMKFKSF